MNELSAALRQFADRIEAGELLPGATQCAIILANEGEVQATYIGRQAPAAQAGINLLAAGIARFNVAESVTTPVGKAGENDFSFARAQSGDGSIFGGGR